MYCSRRTAVWIFHCQGESHIHFGCTELVRDLRQSHKHIHSIAQTGMDAAEYKQPCREAGFAGYLMRSLDLNRLLNKIASVNCGGTEVDDGNSPGKTWT